MNNSLNNLTEQSTTKKPFSMKIHPDAFSEVRTNFLSPKPNSSVNPIGKESPLEKENFFLNKSHSFKNEFDSREYKKVFLKKLCLVSLELGLNLLGLINLILMTYYRLGYIDDNYINACLAIEIVMLLFFLAQTFNLLFIGKKRGFFWQIKIEICLNLLMCFQILWMTSHPNFLQVHEDFSILINVIRSFRIFTIKNFSIEIKKIYSLEESETEDTTIQITYFVVDNIINVISAIFIEATLFLALDYMLDFQGYTKLRDHDFEYISSLYFSIVTLSTIGYGDIFPINMWTRLVMIIILFINLSVVSIFLGRLADLIYQISPYKKEYNIKNQMIIIGDVPVSLLRYFLLEIQELDKIQRNLLQLHEKFSLKNVLIVDKKKPTAEQEFLFNDPAFDFDINYLMDNMVNKNWYKLSNIKFAKHVVLFAIDPNDDDSLNTQQDLAMIAMAHRIEAEFNVKITLVLSTDVSENLQRNFSPNVTIISHSLLNNQILANSLENQGFNTWLSHLMTLREKKLPFASEESAAESNFFRLYEYAKNMTQEIYPIS